MNAFIAWTPLHMINIINVAINFYADEVNDLFIYDEFSGSDELFKKIKKEAIFRNVYKISHKEIGSTTKKITSLLINKQKFVDVEEPYKRIFIQGENYFAKLLYGQMKKKNPEVELHYIEDGLGAYVASPIIRNDNKGNRLIKTLNRHSIFHASFSSFLVYEPDLVSEKSTIPHYQIPKLKEKNIAFAVIKRVFKQAGKTVSTLKNHVLFFDQPLQSDNFIINEKKVLRQLEEVVTSDQLIVKLHPRSPIDKYEGINKLDTELPWEIYCLQSVLENTLLISIATTASFTPYLMFDIQTPVVLLASFCLEEINKEERIKDSENTIVMLRNIIRFAEKFKTITGAEVYLPTTMEDVKSLFKENKNKAQYG